MIVTKSKIKKYAWGDYIDTPTDPTFKESDLYGGQKEIKLLPNSNDDITKWNTGQQTKTTQKSTGNPYNQYGQYLSTVGSALSNSKQYNDNSYLKDRQNTKNTVDGGIGAVSAAFPLVGGFLKLGEGVGEQTTDKNGIYKDNTGQFIDQTFNPVTGIQGVTDTYENPNASALLSQFTLGISDLFGTRSASQQKARKAKSAAEEEQRIQAEKATREYSRGILANYPTTGYGKYGMKFANGGNLPVPTDGSGVDQLASNMAQYSGDTHEQGGITLDTNNDGGSNIEIEDKEVIKDNMVLSDRLKPSDNILDVVKQYGIKIQPNDTYATIAARLGEKKGKYEDKLNSFRIGEKNTATISIQRLDNAVDLLFQDQQQQNADMKNEQYKYGGKYAIGGLFTDPTNPTKPKFKTEAEHINYYRPIAVKNFDAEDLAAYNNFITTQGQTAADAFIAARGGLPPFEPIKKEAYIAPNPTDWKNLDSNISAPQGYRYGARGGKGLPAKGSITVPKYAFGDYFNSGDLYNTIGGVANQAQINQLETNYDPTLVNAPRYSYRDRSGYLKNTFGKQFTTATQGLNQSSQQDNLALKTNLYAQTLNSLNGALDNEAQRKDNIDNIYNQQLSNTSYANTNIMNTSKALGLENRNQRRALTQANLNSMIRGYMGNQTQRDLQQLDFDKAYINASKDGDRGVFERWQNTLPEDLKKRRFGQYK